MGDQSHPFHAVAALAATRGQDRVRIKVAQNGDYVRLYATNPPLFFKHRNDPSDPVDRAEFNDFKRILLSEEDCASGPKATLALIESLLGKFADYDAQRPQTKPKSGRDQ